MNHGHKPKSKGSGGHGGAEHEGGEHESGEHGGFFHDAGHMMHNIGLDGLMTLMSGEDEKGKGLDGTAEGIFAMLHAKHLVHGTAAGIGGGVAGGLGLLHGLGSVFEGVDEMQNGDVDDGVFDAAMGTTAMIGGGAELAALAGIGGAGMAGAASVLGPIGIAAGLAVAGNNYIGDKGWLGHNEDGSNRSVVDWGVDNTTGAYDWANEGLGGGVLGAIGGGVVGGLAGAGSLLAGTGMAIGGGVMAAGEGLWNGTKAVGRGIGNAAEWAGEGIMSGASAVGDLFSGW